MVKSMERDFWFDLNPAEEDAIADTGFVDLAQVGSLVNRVSLRQGMEYVVESMELFTTGTATAMVFRLPEHWPCLNAWEKTFHAWKNQQRDAAREAGLESTLATYNDFKIFFNSAHHTSGFAANLLPIGYTITQAVTEYDWEESEVVVPNDGGVAGATAEYNVHMLGDDSASKAMIVAYGQSRARVFAADPNVVNVPSGGLFGEMIDVGEIQEEVVDNIQQENNRPPYVIANQTAEEYYPGGENQGLYNKFGNYDGALEDILSVRAGSSSVSSDSMGGFVAPCGLLYLSYSFAGSGLPSPQPQGVAGSALLRITLAPGNYKGLLAQSMQEAN